MLCIEPSETTFSEVSPWWQTGSPQLALEFPLWRVHENRAYTSRDDRSHARRRLELHCFATIVSNQLAHIYHSCLPCEAVPLQLAPRLKGQWADHAQAQRRWLLGLV